jgi:DNA polymerase III subunit epsilon
LYAIVDIETTGGTAADNRIIEIAVAVFDGKKIVNEYQSLVNPGRSIPRFIVGLTGISDQMVASAPPFEEIAGIVHELLHDKIFVAHNVNFDHSFVKKELESVGKHLNVKKLCTVRLSRKIIPGLPSYSLGKLCNSLSIEHLDKHRAAGDTGATVRLFDMLLKKDSGNFISASLKKNSREALLPPHLNKEEFDNIPKKTGVYYFLDQKGKVIYVGKAKNLKQRVASHFAGNSESRAKSGLVDKIHSINYQVCGNELVALLLEASEIKRLWPAYNYALKNPETIYGIYEYQDRNGLIHLGINKSKKINSALITFSNLGDARNFLLETIKQHRLCLKYCGLQNAPGECLNHSAGCCDGICINKEEIDSYNERAKKAVLSFQNEFETFAVIGEGREKNEVSVVLSRKGQCIAYGYSEKKSLDYNDHSSLFRNVKPYPHYSYTGNLLSSMISRDPEHKIIAVAEEAVNLAFDSYATSSVLNLWSGN